MKYVEELLPSNCFRYKDDSYLLTNDFRKNGQKLAYSLTTGFCRWFDANTMVDLLPIYGLDADNNLYPIKPMESSNVDLKNQNIS